ncbi:HAD family hydrolase [Devosia albogilva]
MTAIIPAAGFTEEEVLRLAASVERASEHPLALAIGVRSRRERTGDRTSCRFRLAHWQGRAWRGRRQDNPAWQCNSLPNKGSMSPRWPSRQTVARGWGNRAIFMGINGQVAAIFAIADPVKASTPEALAALKARGIRVVMLTGDNWTTAKAVARQLGIDEVEARSCPIRRARSCSGTRRRRGGGDGRRRGQ